MYISFTGTPKTGLDNRHHCLYQGISIRIFSHTSTTCQRLTVSSHILAKSGCCLGGLIYMTMCTGCNLGLVHVPLGLAHTSKQLALQIILQPICMLCTMLAETGAAACWCLNLNQSIICHPAVNRSIPNLEVGGDQPNL